MSLRFRARNGRHARRGPADPAPVRHPALLGDGASLRDGGPLLPGPAYAGLQVRDGTAFAVIRLGGGREIRIEPAGAGWLDLLAHAAGEARDALNLEPDDDGKRM